MRKPYIVDTLHCCLCDAMTLHYLDQGEWVCGDAAGHFDGN